MWVGSSHGLRLKDSQAFFESHAGRMGNRGLNQWTIVERSQTMTDGTAAYSLSNVIDILSAVVRRSNVDYALERISRDAYQNIPTKSTDGRPSQFFLIVR